MFKTSRRGFLVGCSSAIASMAGAQMNRVVFGNPEDEPNQNIMIVIFLRGGCDAINFITPMGGEDRAYYEAARDSLRLPASGEGALLQLGSSSLGLHPRATHLYDLFNDNKLALIPATGMHSNTRSHFDAMQYMELGTPDSKSATSGWLTRHLKTTNLPWQEDLLPVLGVGDISPTSLSGTYHKVSMSNVSDFRMDRGFSPERDAQRGALRSLYRRKDSVVHNSGLSALDAADIVELNSIGGYTPENGADYPGNSFGNQLQLVAQMIKLQLGMRIATIDLGGWDTHENQGYGDPSAGYFADRIGMLSQGMKALFDDLNGSQPGTDYTNRISVVCMSEFGRRLKENENRGTDHGHGGFMAVMGGETNGGLYGQWPGLHTDQLYDNADLAVTTDYRRVLSELLIRRFGNPNLGTIFPDYTNYSPIGLVQGADLAPNYETITIDVPDELNKKAFLPTVR